MQDNVTYGAAWPASGRSVALVAFLFGVSGRPELTGSTLRALLTDLGRSDDASRALLSRMHRGGQLTAERHGRETTYRLAGSFARGFEYIRRQPTVDPPTWDGWFHTVLYRAPEQSRWFRDALRRTAVMSGYGELQSGSWWHHATIAISSQRTWPTSRSTPRSCSDGSRWTARTQGG